MHDVHGVTGTLASVEGLFMSMLLHYNPLKTRHYAISDNFINR